MTCLCKDIKLYSRYYLALLNIFKVMWGKKRAAYRNRGESFRHSSKSSLTVILRITKNTIDANNSFNSSQFFNVVCPYRDPLRCKRPPLGVHWCWQHQESFRKDELNQSFPLDGFAINISRVLPCESKEHLFKTKPKFVFFRKSLERRVKEIKIK